MTGRAASETGPAREIVAVVPDDAQDLQSGPARSLYVGGGGSLRIIDLAGNDVTLISGSHQYHPLMARRVFRTGTTATDILALY
jgi:hypothetical protein